MCQHTDHYYHHQTKMPLSTNRHHRQQQHSLLIVINITIIEESAQMREISRAKREKEKIRRPHSGFVGSAHVQVTRPRAEESLRRSRRRMALNSLIVVGRPVQTCAVLSLSVSVKGGVYCWLRSKGERGKESKKVICAHNSEKCRIEVTTFFEGEKFEIFFLCGVTKKMVKISDFGIVTERLQF